MVMKTLMTTMYLALGANSDCPQALLRMKMTIDVIQGDSMRMMKRYDVKHKTQDGSEKLTWVMLTDQNHGTLRNSGRTGRRHESLDHFHEMSVSCTIHDHRSYCVHMKGYPNCVGQRERVE